LVWRTPNSKKVKTLEEKKLLLLKEIPKKERRKAEDRKGGHAKSGKHGTNEPSVLRGRGRRNLVNVVWAHFSLER